MTYKLTTDCPWGKAGDVFQDTGVTWLYGKEKSITDSDAFILRKLNVLVEVEEEVFPVKGDTYWYVDSFGDVLPRDWEDNYGDNFKKTIGNLFKTEAEAVAHRASLLKKD